MRVRLLALFLALAAPATAVELVRLPALPLTPDVVNSADLMSIAAGDAEPGTGKPDPAIVRLQTLLDRAGASPGVIDGFDGDNVRKAVVALELMLGLPTDGLVDPDVLGALDSGTPVIGAYQIVQQDLDAIGPPIPTDYAEQALMPFLGYASLEEELAERFHMDVDLLKALNPTATYAVGSHVYVAAYGPDRRGEVARIEADKALRQVRAYDAEDRLLVAYPATIGSTDTPSPSGSHTVNGVARLPEYTYNPENFVQGDNTSVLTLPPGPNGPVGSMWIDLSEPSFGIHGTPEPSLIDKTASHGCVRLTNWDANELAKMVKPGVRVDFVG